MRKCPHCLKKISDTARKCKYCGEWLENERENRMNNKDTSSRVMKHHNVTFDDNYINNGIDERKQGGKSSYKYLIFIIPIIFMGILFLIPRMESVNPETIEYVKQMELEQKRGNDSKNNTSYNDCSKIVKRKYNIIDEYTKCTGKISGKGIMGENGKELMKQWYERCLSVFISDYDNTEDSQIYNKLGCNGTELDILRQLDLITLNFVTCFQSAAGKKANTSEEAHQLIQNTFKCNEPMAYDYAKLIPYIEQGYIY